LGTRAVDVDAKEGVLAPAVKGELDDLEPQRRCDLVRGGFDRGDGGVSWCHVATSLLQARP
jgi:hypothetical protein